ncbi:MAG: hypothetical protein M3P32_08715 [Chloroflexota bacterium]|nr:hypothetical protein [Chloroflexota bacterium]
MVALVSGLVLGATLPIFGGGSGAAGAVRPTFYVDGKIGTDPPFTSTPTSWGQAANQPFKTLRRALDETQHAMPTAIRVRGYSDYVYNETISRGYSLGSAATPVEISSYTTAELPAGQIVRPLIDGGLSVGTTGWSRPWAAYTHVWCKTWMPPGPNLISGQTVPPGYDTAIDGTHDDRLYMDGTQPLHRPAQVPTMAQLDAQPYSQYWDRTKATNNLCVHLGLWSGAAVDENPSNHTIVVPWYLGIVLNGGSSYTTIRDLRIAHTIMGVGFSVSKDPAVGKAHHNAAINVDASYGYRAGFWTAGDNNLFDRISGTRNSIQLVKLDIGAYNGGTIYGARNNIVRNATSIENMAHGIKIFGKQTQYNWIYANTIDGGIIPAAAKGNGGATRGIEISNGASYNSAWRNYIAHIDAAVMLYQYDASGGPLVGNVFHHNQFRYDGIGVFLWDAKVNSAFGTGATTFANNIYYDVQIGIGGNATTSGKVFTHESMYHTGFNTAPFTASIEKAAVQVVIGTITLRDSVIYDTNGPSICPRVGASVVVSYTDVAAWRSDPRSSMPHGPYCYSTSQHAFGVVRVSAAMYLAPGFNTNPTSPSFLVIPSTSPVYGKASDGASPGI